MLSSYCEQNIKSYLNALTLRYGGENDVCCFLFGEKSILIFKFSGEPSNFNFLDCTTHLSGDKRSTLEFIMSDESKSLLSVSIRIGVKLNLLKDTIFIEY